MLLAQDDGLNWTDATALIALLVIIAGLTLGSIAAALTRRIASGEKRPEAVRSSVGALSTLAFSIILIVALVIALGIVNSEALDQLSRDLVSFMPKALSAAIMLILGNVVGSIAETGVARSLGHVAPEVRNRVPALVKWGVMGFAIVIAANQLSIDTTIIIVAVASVFFSIGLAAAMLAGLGGQHVARQIAAGRALRQLVTVGDTIRTDRVGGVVKAIGSTNTQITTFDEDIQLVPNAELLGDRFQIVPAAEPETPDEIEQA
jgi:small-conductance mechanosensitive channel